MSEKTGTGSRQRRLALVLMALAVPAVAAGAEDGNERLARLEEAVARIEAQLAELRDEAPDGRPEAAALKRQIAVLAEEIARLRAAGPSPSEPRSFSLGGYGEARYENFDGTTGAGDPSGKEDRVDLTRLVLYVGHRFGERWHLTSEIEFEHALAGDGEPGEVAIEQAYLGYRVSEGLELRAGLLLIPLGFINETHEPPTFPSVNRPSVERYIIPATWRELGAGLSGGGERLRYRAYVTSGLDAAGFGTLSGLRGGRGSGAEARAADLSLTGRLDVAAAPSLTLGAALFAGKTGQGRLDGGGAPIAGDLALYDLHAEWRFRGLRVRALWAAASLDDADRLATLAGETIGSRMTGWYLEAACDVLSSSRHQLLPFVRHERFDTLDRVPAGAALPAGAERRVTTVGLAWKPIEEIALKLDRQDFDGPDGGVDQWNFGIGFMF